MSSTPPKQFYNLQSLNGFGVQILSGNRLVWNVIGNNSSGDTFGISGILFYTAPSIPPVGVQTSMGNIGDTTLGTLRTYNS